VSAAVVATSVTGGALSVKESPAAPQVGQTGVVGLIPGSEYLKELDWVSEGHGRGCGSQ
jgi:hypothetical protein